MKNKYLLDNILNGLLAVFLLLLFGCVADTGQKTNLTQTNGLSDNSEDSETQTSEENNSEDADSLISIKDEEYYGIIGQWQDANSLVEYLENGDFKGKWRSSEKDGDLEITNNMNALGSWYKMGDTLKMRFTYGHAPDYLIVKQTADTFVIKSLDDGVEFVKIRKSKNEE